LGTVSRKNLCWSFPKKNYRPFRLNEPQFSIADAQQVLPLAKFALEAHALGNLKRRDDQKLQCETAARKGRFLNLG